VSAALSYSLTFGAAIGRHLVAEMQSRLQHDDTGEGWDALTYLAYSMQERATALLSEQAYSVGGQPDQLTVEAARVMLGMSTAEFFLAIGQSQFAGREATKAMRILDGWSAGSWEAVEAGWRQMLHTPPAESAVPLREAKGRLWQLIEQAHRELRRR
jgi:hypothetical protein